LTQLFASSSKNNATKATEPLIVQRHNQPSTQTKPQKPKSNIPHNPLIVVVRGEEVTPNNYQKNKHQKNT
jgi:hypothetical protein